MPKVPGNSLLRSQHSGTHSSKTLGSGTSKTSTPEPYKSTAFQSAWQGWLADVAPGGWQRVMRPSSWTPSDLQAPPRRSNPAHWQLARFLKVNKGNILLQ